MIDFEVLFCVAVGVIGVIGSILFIIGAQEDVQRKP